MLLLLLLVVVVVVVTFLVVAVVMAVLMLVLPSEARMLSASEATGTMVEGDTCLFTHVHAV